MNRNLLLAGGLVLVAGGLSYWYLSQYGNGVPKICSDYSTQQQCIENNCYWYDGSCHSTPQGVEPCTQGMPTSCYQNVAGYRACDRYNNLCECNGTSWHLIKENSYICENTIEHNRCYANQDGQVICMPYAGQGNDQCEPGYPAGCPCNPPDTWCQEGYTCEPIIKECVKNAYQLPVNVSPDNWKIPNGGSAACQSSPNPGWNESGMQCYFMLDDLHAATMLTGAFSWEWGFPSSKGTLNVYGYLDGIGWIYLDSHHWDMWATEGNETINMNFPIQGISGLLFQCYGSAWTNVKPKSFYGHLNI